MSALVGQPYALDNRIQLAVSAITSSAWCKCNVYFSVIVQPSYIFITESSTSSFGVCETKTSIHSLVVFLAEGSAF